MDEPSCAEIVAAVCQVFGISRNEFLSTRRAQHLCDARHVFYWVARKFTTKSYPQIGRFAAGRDHTTVMHGVQKIDSRFEDYRDRIAKVLEVLPVDREVAA